MAGEIVITSQTVTIDAVSSDVSVSSIAHDDVVGDFYRTITVWGTPAEGDSNIPAVLVVHIRADTVDPLKITVPQDEF
jgi:hypothetical protein